MFPQDTVVTYITSGVCVLTISRKISRAYLSYRGRKIFPSFPTSGSVLLRQFLWMMPVWFSSLVTNIFPGTYSWSGAALCPFLSVLCPCVEELVFFFSSIRMLSRHRCFLSGSWDLLPEQILTSLKSSFNSPTRVVGSWGQRSFLTLSKPPLFNTVLCTQYVLSKWSLKE